TVRARDGHIPVDDLIEAMDAKTRVATVSTVSFAPGFRTDVEKLGKVCRERDVLLLVDGAQSVGVQHTDVHASKIDALAVSTQKGLLALYGMGFLYVRREWARRFDLGNYNFLATAAADTSMKQLLEWDTRRIEPYVQGLAHALARGFLDL